MRMIFRLVRAALVAIVVLAVVFMVGMRTKSAPVQNAVRRMNRAYMNPRQMGTAGKPGSYASIVHHVGRKSGQPYETPIGAVRTDDGFVIALPYGTAPDWLRNVLASGSARIDHEGETFETDQPEVVPIDAAAGHFAPNDQRVHRVFGIDEALRLRVSA